ncbi:MAG: hypothetical protein WC700_04035 [Gemmatimonadaceae bacterium]|jgi:hypothetical protein
MSDDFDELLSDLGLGPDPEPPATAVAAKKPTTTMTPSIEAQKLFIIDNATLLDTKTKKAILSLVMMEIGPGVFLNTLTEQKEVNINLDLVAEANSEVLTGIYNIVHARRELLNQPARTIDRAVKTVRV